MAEPTKIQVGVINASTSLMEDKNRAEVDAVVAALQSQVRDHFSPVWGIHADITLVENDPEGCPRLEKCPHWWWLVLLDTSDVAGYYGYQDFTRDGDGMPLGKVFVRDAVNAKREWSVTASHELLEMLADPWLNWSVFKRDADSENRGLFYACDICDPCQEETYPINAKGRTVQVSNFVYPTWFDLYPQGAAQFDYKKTINRAFELRPGGYISVFDVPLGTGWRQIHEPLPGKKLIYNLQPEVGSRRERRKRRMSGHEKKSPPVITVPRISG